MKQKIKKSRDEITQHITEIEKQLDEEQLHIRMEIEEQLSMQRKQIKSILEPELKLHYELLEISIFLNVLKVHFDLSDVSHLIDEPLVRESQETSPLFALNLFMPLANEGGAKAIDYFTGMYFYQEQSSTPSELVSYFKDLRQALEGWNYPIAVILGNARHTIAIGLHGDKWMLANLSAKPNFSSGKIVEFYVTDEALTNAVMRSFLFAKNLPQDQYTIWLASCVCINAYPEKAKKADISQEDYLNDIQSRLKEWRQHPEHQITAQKAQIKDFWGVNWLEKAVKFNQEKEVAALLKLYTGTGNEKTVYFGKLLHLAAKYGWVSIANQILKYQPDINIRTYGSITPLMIAAQFGHPEYVRLLLQYNANLYMQNKDGKTAAQIAEENGFNNIKAHIEHHMAVTEKAKEMILLPAVKNGNAKTVASLLKQGANPHLIIPIDKHTKQPAIRFACEQGHFDIASLFLHYGAAIDKALIDQYGEKLFSIAVDKNLSQAVKVLLENSVSPEIELVNLAHTHKNVEILELFMFHGTQLTDLMIQEYAEDLLLFAAAKSHIKIVEFMLTKMPHLIQTNGLFLHAAANNDLAMGKLLLAHGFSNINEMQEALNFTQSDNKNAVADLLKKQLRTIEKIQEKIKKQDLVAIKKLVVNGFNPNQPFHDNRSMLAIAVEEKCFAVVELLIQLGTDVSRQLIQENYKALLFQAINEKHADVVLQLLKEKPENQNINTMINDKGMTPLTLAAKKSSPHIIEILLTHGAKPDFRDSKNHTSLYYAKKQAGPKTIIILQTALDNLQKEAEKLKEPTSDYETAHTLFSSNPPPRNNPPPRKNLFKKIFPGFKKK